MPRAPVAYARTAAARLLGEPALGIHLPSVASTAAVVSCRIEGSSDLSVVG